MMKLFAEIPLEFITPAFLCGANQSQAELRPASVRGQLRWWFRVLGGNRDMEQSVFGGVHDNVQASKIVVRISNLQPRHDAFRAPAQGTGTHYLCHFAMVSGERKGIRTGTNAFFSPGTRFTLNVFERFTLDENERNLLIQTLEAFSRLGALGLRGTRGYGAFAPQNNPMSELEFSQWKSQFKCVLIQRAGTTVFNNAGSLLDAFGNALKAFRKNQDLPAERSKTALGFSDGNERQASALRLRPVRVKEGFIPVLVYTDQVSKYRSIRDYLSSFSI